MRKNFLRHLAKLVTKERSESIFSEERSTMIDPQDMVKNKLVNLKLEASSKV